MHKKPSDLTTHATDTPLTIQFASSSPLELSRAASLVQPFVSSVDLNCGCPQSWACAEGIGASLMHQRDLVTSMIKAVKARCGNQFCMSVKIRVHRDLRETVDFVRAVEGAGVDYIGVHGRLRSQRSSEPVDLEAIRLVKESVACPVVANGDAFSLKDAERIAGCTGVDGVMSARGLQENPALFAGFEKTPREAVRRFVELAVRFPIPFALVKQHVWDMTIGVLEKAERKEILDVVDMLELVDWVEEHV
ncbi:MAG: hypothetical protein M1834_005526 [Cirrosporium novae-zelandiae]|nr:MAG: hypothetical protein M1834_005526 [Cirrosporium novae-zelandiae]